MIFRRKAVPLATMLVILISLFAIGGNAQAATATVDNPYGFTDTQANFTAQAVTDMHDVGLTWVRSQLDWASIETSNGTYNWSSLDATVSRANAANVNLVFPIRNAPSFHLTQTCTTADGKFSKTFPGPSDMAQFATAVATRYNGANGHGTIAAIQIGNEEWDNAQFGTLSESVQCRQPSFYAPVLAAAYDAIKAVDPNILVIGAGLFWKDTQHQHDWYAYLYQHGDADKFDAGAFHYYMCTYDPNVGNGSAWPKFNDILAAIQQADTENGVTKPIWVTETGWTINGNNQNSSCIVTQAKVAQYMTEELDDARTSGLVSKLF